MSAFLHEIEKFFLITCNSVYSELTFDLSVLFHACHVYRGLEPLKTVPAYHLSHLPTAKTQTSIQSLFCYRSICRSVLMPNTTLLDLAQLGSYITTNALRRDCYG